MGNPSYGIRNAPCSAMPGFIGNAPRNSHNRHDLGTPFLTLDDLVTVSLRPSYGMSEGNLGTAFAMPAAQACPDASVHTPPRARRPEHQRIRYARFIGTHPSSPRTRAPAPPMHRRLSPDAPPLCALPVSVGMKVGTRVVSASSLPCGCREAPVLGSALPSAEHRGGKEKKKKLKHNTRTPAGKHLCLHPAPGSTLPAAELRFVGHGFDKYTMVSRQVPSAFTPHPAGKRLCVHPRELHHGQQAGAMHR